MRILCTFFIIYRHFLYSGVILNVTGVNEVICKLLHVVFYPAVDIYVVISAYFLSQKMSEKWQWGKMFKLYVHTALVGLIAYLSLIPTGYMPKNDWFLLQAIFPFCNGEFWFFNAYITMLFTAPLLNMMLKRLPRKRHLFLCIVIVVFAQLSGYISGYSLPLVGTSGLWFMLIYILTAYLSMYNIELKSKLSVFIGFVLYCAAFAVSYFIPWSHVSMPTVYMAIFLFLLFKRINIKNVAISKVICIISSTTYGVYIIHCAPALQAYMYEGIFHLSSFFTSKYIVLILLGFSAVTFAVCSALDLVRQLVFKLVETLYAKTLKGKIKPPAFLVRLNERFDAYLQTSSPAPAAVAPCATVPLQTAADYNLCAPPSINDNSPTSQTSSAQTSEDDAPVAAADIIDPSTDNPDAAASTNPNTGV